MGDAIANVRLSQSSKPLTSSSSCTTWGDWACSFSCCGSVPARNISAPSMMTSPLAGQYLVYALLTLQLYCSSNSDSWFHWCSILGYLAGLLSLSTLMIIHVRSFRELISTWLLTWRPSPCCLSVCPSWPGVPAWELLNLGRWFLLQTDSILFSSLGTWTGTGTLTRSSPGSKAA